MKRRMLIGTGGIALAILVTLVVWQQSFDFGTAGPENAEQTLLVWSVSTLVFLLTVTLGFMLFRTGVKLYVERRKNQERWMSDEVRVLVGTIAFGLGINKATVRAVIHLALPKSVEQFYQEAGRAGRDGNPADCVLLWRKQDAGILGYFANQITDNAERDRAWQRYYKIREFAEAKQCRHRQICTHFGETPKWNSCNACDVCGKAADWMVLAASKAAVRERVASSTRTRSVAESASQPQGEVDTELREYLREWRRNTAKEQGMPAYVVLHDTTLEEICQIKPSSISELLTVTGVGQRKAELYGQEILQVLNRYQEGARASALPQKMTAPGLETLQLLQQGKTLEEIAQIRGRQLGTVVNAVAALVESGQVEFQPGWIDANRDSVIAAACQRAGLENLTRLKPLKDVLPPEITYEEIRLVVARLRRETEQKKSVPA